MEAPDEMEETFACQAEGCVTMLVLRALLDVICFPSRRIQFLAPPGVAASSFNRPIALPYWGHVFAVWAVVRMVR